MTATELVLGGTLQIRDEDKREVECFVLPWNTDAESYRGIERFEKGAFSGIDPSAFVFRQRHQDPPTGRGISLEERDDGLYMGFRIAKTAAGDEQLELIREGVETGVSVGFEDGKFDRTRGADGKMRFVHKSVQGYGQLEVSTTWKPAFRQASVLQVRESDNVTDEQETTPVATAMESPAPVANPIADKLDAIFSRLDRADEKMREFAVAAVAGIPAAGPTHMTRQVKLEVRELAEVVTTDNLGVLPDSLSSELIGRVESGRHFMNGTRQVPAPATGLNLVYPKLTQMPLVSTQAAEKDEVASRKTIITTEDWGMVSKAGAGDLSIQLIKRSSPEFLSLWLELLGQAYAIDSENGAVDALLAESAVVEGTGTFDPSTDTFGEAFSNTVSATNRLLKPNRIFLSTTALIQFMDAKTPSGGGGTAMYPALAGITGLSAGGTDDLGFQLQPIWVPALDDEVVDIIIGPSGGFVWAEDGTYTLQADVPSKAGRDVGVVGMLWYAPIYPAAFTTYVVAT